MEVSFDHNKYIKGRDKNFKKLEVISQSTPIKEKIKFFEKKY